MSDHHRPYWHLPAAARAVRHAAAAPEHPATVRTTKAAAEARHSAAHDEDMKGGAIG